MCVCKSIGNLEASICLSLPQGPVTFRQSGFGKAHFGGVREIKGVDSNGGRGVVVVVVVEENKNRLVKMSASV